MRLVNRMLLAVLAFAIMAVAARADVERWIRQGWKTDFTKMSVPVTDVLSGGPPRDGIPSIDSPRFRPLSEATDIPGREPVIWLEVDGDIRAYPLRILTYHEIVNDTVGGVPAAITYCPLCNASIVFDRRVGDTVLDFGTTGKLRNSDLIMYDRQTDSWWQQFTGESIAGSYLGTMLKMLPSRVTSLDEIRDSHPNAKILVPSNANYAPYWSNPYRGYDTRNGPYGFFTGELPDYIPAMARVVIVRGGGEPIIVSLEKVRKDGFEIDGYEISWKSGVASALDRQNISKSRDVGSVRVRKNGKDAVHDVTFAFVAHAFHPDIRIVTE